MTGDQVVSAVIDALHAVQVPFMIVGSLACNFHGVPRSTRDADMVVELSPGMLPALRDRLGPHFHVDPQASFETVTGTTRHIVEAEGTVFIVELFELTDDPHDQSRFARRLHAHLFDRDADVATAEDTIVTKLRWARHGGRSKDLEDVRNVIAIQGDALDWSYVGRWCREHETLDLLTTVREGLGG